MGNPNYRQNDLGEHYSHPQKNSIKGAQKQTIQATSENFSTDAIHNYLEKTYGKQQAQTICQYLPKEILNSYQKDLDKRQYIELIIDLEKKIPLPRNYQIKGGYYTTYYNMLKKPSITIEKFKKHQELVKAQLEHYQKYHYGQLFTPTEFIDDDVFYTQYYPTILRYIQKEGWTSDLNFIWRYKHENKTRFLEQFEKLAQKLGENQDREGNKEYSRLHSSEEVAEQLLKEYNEQKNNIKNSQKLKVLFNQEDFNYLESHKDKPKDQMEYLKRLIEADRKNIQAPEVQKDFQNSIEQVKTSIKRYLPQLLGNAIKEPQFIENKNIHLLGKYELYLLSKGDIVTGRFIPEEGNIYINFNNYYKEKYYHALQETLMHEILHSISSIDYSEGKKDWNSIGLQKKIFYEKDKFYCSGTAINEASTDSLTKEILKLQYGEPYVQNLPKSSYQRYIDILTLLEKEDHIPKKIFWNTMINTDKKNEMIEMINREHPYYYQIVSNLLDITERMRQYLPPRLFESLEPNSQKGIEEFIRTKDIKYIDGIVAALKALITSRNKEPQNKNDQLIEKSCEIEQLFEPELLNQDRTDFNEEILQHYYYHKETY